MPFVVEVAVMVEEAAVSEPVEVMLPPNVEVAEEVATMLPVMSLPCAVVEAKDALEVLVSVPTVPAPMVACPMVAMRAVSESKRPFSASRRPEKYPVEAESPVRVVDVPALVTVREPVSVYPVVFVFAA